MQPLYPAAPLEADLSTAIVYDKYSVSPSVRTICTRGYFESGTYTYMIQVCGDVYDPGVW